MFNKYCAAFEAGSDEFKQGMNTAYTLIFEDICEQVGCEYTTHIETILRAAAKGNQALLVPGTDVPSLAAEPKPKFDDFLHQLLPYTIVPITIMILTCLYECSR